MIQRWCPCSYTDPPNFTQHILRATLEFGTKLDPPEINHWLRWKFESQSRSVFHVEPRPTFGNISCRRLVDKHFDMRRFFIVGCGAKTSPSSNFSDGWGIMKKILLYLYASHFLFVKWLALTWLQLLHKSKGSPSTPPQGPGQGPGIRQIPAPEARLLAWHSREKSKLLVGNVSSILPPRVHLSRHATRVYEMRTSLPQWLKPSVSDRSQPNGRI